jgi:hypothetical protein
MENVFEPQGMIGSDVFEPTSNFGLMKSLSRIKNPIKARRLNNQKLSENDLVFLALIRSLNRMDRVILNLIRKTKGIDKAIEKGKERYEKMYGKPFSLNDVKAKPTRNLKDKIQRLTEKLMMKLKKSGFDDSFFEDFNFDDLEFDDSSNFEDYSDFALIDTIKDKFNKAKEKIKGIFSKKQNVNTENVSTQSTPDANAKKDDKIFGMPRKTAIGVGVGLVVIGILGVVLTKNKK